MQNAQMQQAIKRLFEIGACDATPEQIAQVAKEFGVEAWALEGFYFDEVDRLADE